MADHWKFHQQISLGLIFAMTILLLTAMLIGAMLGLRFKILVLVPAVILSSVSTLGIEMAHSNGPWSTALAMVLAIIALQVGYLGGAIIVGVSIRKIAPVITPAIQKLTR